MNFYARVKSALYALLFTKKLIVIMKLTVFLLTLSLLKVSASSLAQKVSISVEEQALEKVFTAIQQQTGHRFFWTDEKLAGTTVSIRSENRSLTETLDLLFSDLPYTYVISKTTVIVKNRRHEEGSREKNPRAQYGTALAEIRGRVTDSLGNPLSGASIRVKGTPQSTMTDQQGNFLLQQVPDKVVLIVSFVGYTTQEVSVTSGVPATIVLRGATNQLDDIVVVGFGTQKRRDVSSAISSVSAKDLQDQTVSNFAQAISGKMAGVRILNSNNAPGGGTNMVIRGITSINASNDPLIVIDGFPLKDGFNQTENPLNSINTADIESIEVLKDASSSAIYGARAANGVILITTKKGKLGKPTTVVTANNGFESMTNRMNVLNREDFLKFMDDARAQSYIVEDPNFGTNDPNAPLWKWTDDDETRIYNWKNFSSNAPFMGTGGTYYEHWIYVTPETKAQPYDTDWQDVTTSTGKVQDFQLSTSGGTDNLKYMISGGYFNQDGIVESTGYKRFSFRSNVDLQVNNWLKTGLLLAPALENFDLMHNMESTFFDIVRIPPIYRPYNDAGEPQFLGYVPGDFREWNLDNFSNPLSNSMVKDNRQTIKSLSTVFGEISILKDLVLRSEFHTEFKNWERANFIPASFPDPWSTTRSSALNNVASRLYWNSQSFLTYNRVAGQHSFNAILGYSAEKSADRSSYMLKFDFPTDHVPTLNQAVTVLDAQNHVRTNRSAETMIGSFARVMYNYMGKYYFTGSVRRDGSSKFGANKKWGVFPSFSAAWRVSDETFFSPVKSVISDLKFRGGWGVIGNSGIGNYNALSTLSATSYLFGSGATIAPGYVNGRVSNAGLGWEATSDLGLGIDAALLNNRISVSADYFYRLTKDMLFYMPLPTITGFSSYMMNIGSMRNRGFEYLVQTRNLTGAFSWTTNYNLSYYRNRVLDTGKDKRPLIDNNSYTSENKPLAGLWGMHFLGPYRDWEDVKTNPIINPHSPIWRDRSVPGTNKMQDVNGDGVINGLDNTILGSPNPDFIWSITNNFAYKGFDLSVQVNGVSGGDRIMTLMEGVMSRTLGHANVVYEYYDNYWRPDRPDAKYGAPNRKSWDGTPNRGTLVFKGTYVNFQNIAFGYTLPTTLLQQLKLGAGPIRIYTSVRNAWMITKYPGYNPEVNSSGNAALAQSVDGGSYPMTRTISIGLNMSL